MFDTDVFVADLIAALAEPQAVLAAKELVVAAVSDGVGVIAALGEPAVAGITPLYRSDTLTVLNVVWAPHMSLYPHDHNLWACIGIYGGREDNAFFRRGPGGVGLVDSGNRTIGDAEALLLGDDVIHAIHNPEGRFTGALHVYGGDFFDTPRSEWEAATATAVEVPRDLRKTARVFAEANAAWAAASSPA